MSYNLFLDDIRTIDIVYPKKDIDFVIVRSYDDCIAYIKENGLPEFMSFDNDLGEDENKIVLPDGYAVAKWLVYESGFDLTNFKFNVHSANPVAKDQIEGLLNNYMKFIRAKENSLELLLEDFTNHNTRKITNVKPKVNPLQSLKERAILGLTQLAKQQPCTLSQMRAQALTVKMYSGEFGEYTGRKGEAPYLDESIKYDLRMYFPKFSEEQIEEGLIKLYSIYNESII